MPPDMKRRPGRGNPEAANQMDQKAGETNTAIVPRPGRNLAEADRMPCRTRGCSGTRPLTLIGSSRGWDKCTRCTGALLPRQRAQSAYEELVTLAEWTALVEHFGSPGEVLAAVRDQAQRVTAGAAEGISPLEGRQA